MPPLPNDAGKSPASGQRRSPDFLLELEPWHRVFLSNLADLFRPAPRQLRLSTFPGRYWADAQVHRPVAWGAIGQSSLLHAAALALIFSLNYLWLHQPRVLPDDLRRTRPLDHYVLTDYLPAVNSTPSERPRPPVRREAQQADPEYAPQEIVTIHPQPNSIRQTIVNPVNPEPLSQDKPLPNIIAWTPIPSPAPIASNHPLNQTVPAFTPDVAPPPEDTAQRNLNALQFPVAQPQVAEPAATVVNRNLSAVRLPAGEQAPPPNPNLAQRNLGEINMALSRPTAEAPRLLVPEQVVVAGGQRSTIARPQTGGGGGTPAPPAIAGAGKNQGRDLGQLIVLNAVPSAPRGPVAVPEGSRQGEFAAGPTGRVGATGRPEVAAGGMNSPSAGKDGLNVPSIFVAAPPKKINAEVAVSAPAPAPVKPDFPRAAGTQKAPDSGNDDAVFGDKKFYSMVLNMPNLNSGGGSWILRFAELNPIPGSNGEGVSGPVALTKADPAYPAALVRDRIEGVVVLYAVIHSDGHVGEIRVLESVHEVLDENARNALLKWRFRPGHRNGVPVDLEAVIRIPFRVPRSTF